MVAVAALTTGASFTAVTVIVTELESAPSLLSDTKYRTVADPE